MERHNKGVNLTPKAPLVLRKACGRNSAKSAPQIIGQARLEKLIIILEILWVFTKILCSRILRVFFAVLAVLYRFKRRLHAFAVFWPTVFGIFSQIPWLVLTSCHEKYLSAQE